MKKRNILKGIVTLGLAAALTAGLGACGGNSASQTENTPSSAPSESAAETQETQEKTVIIAGTGGSPAPYVTTDENDELTGYDIALLKEVFNRLPQYELQFQLADLPSLMTGVTAGNYHLAINDFGYTEERAENFLFSYPYNATPYNFVQRSDDEPLTSFQDAADRGYTIECFTGEIATAAVENWNRENPDHEINIVYTEAELPAVFEHIVDGVSDFRIDAAPAYNEVIDSYGFDLQGTQISEEETSRITSTLNAYILFPKTEEGEALREDVNAAIKEVYEDGTMTALQKEYLGIDFLPDASEYEKPIN